MAAGGSTRQDHVLHRQRSKIENSTRAYFPKIGLAHPRRVRCLNSLPLTPNLAAPMILVAIFSVIVLLLCWVCYNGDCNNS